MKANNPTSVSCSVKWATVILASAISCLAWTASAKDEVPFKATSSGHTISSTPNPDGSQDNIVSEVGVGTHTGRYTGVQEVNVGAPQTGVYDPATHTVAIPFAASGTFTAANGDTWDFTSEGVIVVPLDANFLPLPPPYAFHSTWEDVGGTGRFAGLTGHGTGEGFIYGDGTTSRIDTGVVSTVGSNKK